MVVSLKQSPLSIALTSSHMTTFKRVHRLLSNNERAPRQKSNMGRSRSSIRLSMQNQATGHSPPFARTVQKGSRMQMTFGRHANSSNRNFNNSSFTRFECCTISMAQRISSAIRNFITWHPGNSPQAIQRNSAPYVHRILERPRSKGTLRWSTTSISLNSRSWKQISMSARSPCINDQLTDARLRTAQLSRTSDDNAFTRLEFLQLGFGHFSRTHESDLGGSQRTPRLIRNCRLAGVLLQHSGPASCKFCTSSLLPPSCSF